MIQAVIFDLDGVIVSTDEFHYQGWQRLADELGIVFDRRVNERLRGVSRMGSLEILLERSSQCFSAAEKTAFCDRKNKYYRALLESLSPADILPGVLKLLPELKARGIKIAIGSSSRNCPTILERVGLTGVFDTVVDGNHITRTKPDPETFLLAAQRLGISPSHCLVVEDAEAGVRAALAAGMRVLAVGSASNDLRAHQRARDLTTVTAQTLLGRS